MKCMNHPEVEAEALCTVCNGPVCEQCRVVLKDKIYCRHCLEARVESLVPGPGTDKSTVLAFLFSLVPGAGYMYLGLMNRGLQAMIIFFGTIFVAGMTELEPLVPLVLPVVLFYSIFDTLQLAGRMREGIPVQDKPFFDPGGHARWANLLGYALIVLGALALLNNYLPQILGYGVVERLISPLLIIALGIFILYRNLRRGSNNDAEGNV